MTDLASIATMSDDEIMNMMEPPAAAEAPGSEAQVEEEVQTTEEEPAAQSGEAEVETPEAEAEVEGEKDPTDPAAVDPNAAPAEGADPAKTPEAAAKDPVEKPAPAAAEAQSVDYEGFYKQIMTPFKANGKTIELKDPKEAIQLMQMGANYTRKLQDIAPHRKVLTMLQNNGLLDEGKLSYLIDLDKKNPEAIKKLIKDAGIDPMDIDTTSEPAYREGNHRVTDAEVNFRQTLDELTSSESGQETIRIINTDWDQASKEVLWESPEIMAVIDQHRQGDVYATISAEVDRQKTLGQISPNTPFLEAYKTVGDQIYGGQQPATTAATPTPGPAPVATTAATPKSPVANDDKANAASPTRTTPRKAEKLVNLLAMSDEDFLKLEPLNGRI